MKAKLGQHFLADDSVLEFEAQSADVKGKSVLEIGAGDGRLTAKLLAHGAGHVTAVELDPHLAKLLRTRFRTRVSVVEKDFLQFEPGKKFNVVAGNIPYYITSPVLFKLSRMDFDRAILCLQAEVAHRMAAKSGSGNYGRLSVSCQLAFEIEVLSAVGRSAFSPSPKVDSCIILLRKTGFLPTMAEERAIAAIFSHRKKSLKNAVVDGRVSLFSSRERSSALRIAQTLKYAGSKVFTLSPQEVLYSARQLVG